MQAYQIFAITIIQIAWISMLKPFQFLVLYPSPPKNHKEMNEPVLTTYGYEHVYIKELSKGDRRVRGAGLMNIICRCRETNKIIQNGRRS
jgi:hypothetical protein